MIVFTCCLVTASSNVYSVCFQALQQLSRRTLTSTARRLVENKVPQKQKLFQVSRSDYSRLMDNMKVHKILGGVVGVCTFAMHISLYCVCFFFFMLNSFLLSLEVFENSLGLTGTVATPCSVTILSLFLTHTDVTL